MNKIISWNVNGVRAAAKKGLWEWVEEELPDIIMLQEIKAFPEQVVVSERISKLYQLHWMPAERKGYSGVAALTKEPPKTVSPLGDGVFDREGRFQTLEYDSFVLINTYFPNSQEKGKRLEYKLAFCDAILDYCQFLRKKKKDLILSGDYNIAHKAIDLKNPKNNEKNPGYLPEERAWMDTFIDAGYIDTFRSFTPEPGHYTWWSYRMRARERDIGWRIDYHCVNKEFGKKIKSATILKDVLGSDHCPVQINF